MKFDNRHFLNSSIDEFMTCEVLTAEIRWLTQQDLYDTGLSGSEEVPDCGTKGFPTFDSWRLGGLWIWVYIKGHDRECCRSYEEKGDETGRTESKTQKWWSQICDEETRRREERTRIRHKGVVGGGYTFERSTSNWIYRSWKVFLKTREDRNS